MPPFSVSGVGAGVGPCVFGRWLVLLPSLALFGGLPLDPDYAVPAAGKTIENCFCSALHCYSLYLIRGPLGLTPRLGVDGQREFRHDFMRSRSQKSCLRTADDENHGIVYASGPPPGQAEDVALVTMASSDLYAVP